ncbi:carbamoyltransferase [Streptomyces sp. NPDC001339]|uniref:carbamoyltransferase family protein n=1 Tax=Streptomyces sp. NPDC001339 TaxID=3364563 RepID=UPI0036891A40
MIVLGLNGWTESTHDPAAALVVDGKVVAFVEEERLNRMRHARLMVPARATEWVLKQAGISLDDVDALAYGWDLPAFYRGRGLGWPFSDADFIRRVTGQEPRRFPRLHWIRHHEAHAASVYFWTGLESAAVLVADGRGEDSSITVYHGQRRTLEPIRSWPVADSLGILYAEASAHCGFGTLDGGKTMGLASYGSPGDPLMTWQDGEIVRPVPCRELARDVHREWRAYFADRFGPGVREPARFDAVRSRRTTRDVPASRLKPHVAAAAQATAEHLMESLARFAVEATGESSLCVAGGVGLNCVANGRLVDAGHDVHLLPASDDAGVALGAAFTVAAEHGEPIGHDGSADLGPGYSAAQVADYLDFVGLDAREVADPAEAALARLLQGQVIGWFQGRSEVGPRALGHRSILSLPAERGQHDRVNALKGREHWRPFAPSLLSEESPHLFGRQLVSPYMLTSFTMTDTAIAEFPAVAHVDGTARPQTVSPGQGPFGRLLHRVKEERGHGVLLNTSFNGPGEPVVCTPEDAVRSFHSMPLDALVIENFLLTKAGRPR